MSGTISVVGAGAIGSLLAALLHKSEVETRLVARGEALAAIQDRGVEVRSKQFGDWVSDVPVVSEIPPGSDVVVAVKAPHLGPLVPTLLRAAPASVLLLQNGLDHVRSVRDAVTCPVVAAAIYVEAAKSEPHVVSHRTTFTRVLLAEEQLHAWVPRALRDAGVELLGGTDEASALWQKFAFLAPLALLTSYFRAPLGEAIGADQHVTEALVDEVAAVASASGLPMTGRDVLSRLQAAPPSMRSSLQRDLERGGSNELDAIGGALVRAAEQVGVDVPVATALVLEIEQRP